ncbi:MAG: acyl-ACP--UDP-N-acetylglucosamine O-acyltransferase [Elusimicrobia bacterium]|nr:acyl-ACP--UDP-N-acetylglucosamine O-acyltransferase [Elusimicrobiota bacterium]
MPGVHSTAVIHPSASIASDAQIGPYTIIGEGVLIGSGAQIGPHCFIEHAQIGKNFKAISHAMIGTPPQDLKYNNEPTKLVVGDNCMVRECVTLNRGTMADGSDGITRVGSNCYFMAYSHVAHDCVVGDHVVMVNCAALGGHSSVGNNVIFGGLSAAHQFVRIGESVMVGGNTGVERDVPPFAMVEGNRGEIIGINIIGLRRRGFNREQVGDMRKAFDLLFFSDHIMEDALKIISAGNFGPHMTPLLDFLKTSSKRGISKSRKSSKIEEFVF